MIRTTTGFECEITAEALDDWELLEDLAEIGSDRSRLVSVCRRLLGEDGMSRLKEHCRDDNGRVRSSRIETEISEIFDGLRKDDSTKN